MKARKKMEKIAEERRATLASLHGSLPRDKGFRSMKSIRTLKRKKMDTSIKSRSMEYIDDVCDQDFELWKNNRSRSLPRNLHQSELRYAEKEDKKLERDRNKACMTERMRRKTESGKAMAERASCYSLQSTKNVSINPDVTQFIYGGSIPRYTYEWLA